MPLNMVVHYSEDLKAGVHATLFDSSRNIWRSAKPANSEHNRLILKDISVFVQFLIVMDMGRVGICSAITC